jgi:putative transcriptional regulator
MVSGVRFKLRPARILCVAAAVTLAASVALAGRWRLIPAQEQDPSKRLAAGKILVARRDFPDPNFAETVILLVQHDEEGSMGLIINRRTKVPLSRLARELESAKGRTEPVFLGGPVETSGVLALVRSRTKPPDSKHVSDEVYMISGKSTLEKSMASGSDPKTFRLYLGYAGWAAGQLESEMELDAWDVIPANTGLVFDPHPETLWTRLVEQPDLQMAGIRKEPSWR